jgi:ribonuclease D
MHSWIDSIEALDAWLAARATPQLIAVDTEFMRTNTFASRLALLQLCIGGEIALVDTVALRRPPSLVARLGDANTCSIMHSAGEDLEAMLPLLPDGPGELFDTQIAAAMAGIGFGVSYQKLVGQLIGVELAKAETRSDWLQRPLSPAQLEYAALDVAWLPQLHEVLARKLEELGRSGWLREDCRALIERVCHAQPDPQPQRAFRSAADWPIERQALLRRLLLWREAAARTFDKPKPWLLDDAHALNLASQPPRGGDELFERTRGLRALRGPQRQELLALLEAPLTDEDRAIERIPLPLDSAQKRAVGEMKAAAAAIAERLSLPETLLCARRHLEALATDRVWPTALEGWRKTLLHDALMAKLPSGGLNSIPR